MAAFSHMANARPKVVPGDHGTTIDGHEFATAVIAFLA
jgi:hypothetical protein